MPEGLEMCTELSFTGGVLPTRRHIINTAGFLSPVRVTICLWLIPNLGMADNDERFLLDNPGHVSLTNSAVFSPNLVTPSQTNLWPGHPRGRLCVVHLLTAWLCPALKEPRNNICTLHKNAGVFSNANRVWIVYDAFYSLVGNLLQSVPSLLRALTCTRHAYYQQHQPRGTYRLF